jgi:hypothetical protein
MLNCPAKRISKKFVGTNYNGKQVYVRKGEDEVQSETVNDYHKKLRNLEQKFLGSLSPMIDVQEISHIKKEGDKVKKEAASATHVDRFSNQTVLPGSIGIRQVTPLQKLPATGSAEVGGNNNLSDALMQASYRRLMEARVLREHMLQERLRSNLAAQEALRQKASWLQHGQANTQAPGLSDELLLSALGQKLSPSSSSMSVGPTGCTGINPAQQYLIDTLKRKMQAEGSAQHDMPVSKRARQA